MSLKRNIWLAYINGIELQYMLNYIVRAGDCHMISEALLGVLGIRYIYPKYFGYKVLLNTDFWV